MSDAADVMKRVGRFNDWLTGAHIWDRVWEKVDRTGDCWEWQGSVDSHGYGQVWDASVGRHRTVTRVVWELTRGPIPDDCGVLHRCDNPRCVRPTHLFAGDQLVNMQDAAAKGRLRSFRDRPLRGEDHPMARLTDAQVVAIRLRYQQGVRPGLLAHEYGTTYQTVWAIGTGRTRTSA